MPYMYALYVCLICMYGQNTARASGRAPTQQGPPATNRVRLPLHTCKNIAYREEAEGPAAEVRNLLVGATSSLR